MFSPVRKALGAVAAGAPALPVASCTSQDGTPVEQRGGAAAGRAGTPRMTNAMITNASAGDTVWDIVRKGAEVAAAKDNVDLRLTSDPAPGNQADLVQNAVDSKVDGIAVTIAYPDEMKPVIQKAKAAGIPVAAFNSGFDAWKETGALMYFGPNEDQ